MENIAQALETVKLLQGWSIWLVGIQTAAVGFLSLLYKNSSGKTGFQGKESLLVGLTIICFGLSILFAMVLNGGIPSAANQLLFIASIKEIPDQSIFAFNFPRTWPTKLYLWGHLEAASFFVGMVFFGWAIWSYAHNRKNT